MLNQIIIENFSQPTRQGQLASPQLVLSLSNPVCGDRIEIDVALANGLVERACFRAWGCAASLAMANIFCTQVQGRTLTELAQLPANDIAEWLGVLEPAQRHCLDMLHQLVAQMKGGQ